MAGNIDRAQRLGSSVEFCGWAANAKDHHAADSVLLFSDGRLVAAVRPTISRPDVAHTLGVTKNSGYSIQVPLSVIQGQNKKAKVQILAVEGGTASPLPRDCTHDPHDFGC